MVNKKTLICKFCGNHRGFVRKYNLNVCRRCFKDHAEKLGFTKYE